MTDDFAADAFDGDRLDLIVPESLNAMRVDRVLSMLTDVSRSESLNLVETGAVQLDDVTVLKASTPVSTGQRLVAQLPAADRDDLRADPGVPVHVVIDDEHFAVIDKDAGVVVHPGAGQRDGTLVAGLLARFPQMAELASLGLSDPVRPGIVHRLDKGTSGLLVVAKTPLGLASLSEQMADRLVERTYLGLVEGRVNEERGVIDAPIGRSTRNPTLMAVRQDGREARTGYRVIEYLERPHVATLLEFRLETGRTHQIRVHAAAIGHPIVNDTRYGHRRDRRLDESRFFLHSASLVFAHPVTGSRVAANSPLPADLAVLLDGAVSA